MIHEAYLLVVEDAIRMFVIILSFIDLFIIFINVLAEFKLRIWYSTSSKNYYYKIDISNVQSSIHNIIISYNFYDIVERAIFNHDLGTIFSVNLSKLALFPRFITNLGFRPLRSP